MAIPLHEPEGQRSVLERAMRILGSFDPTHTVQTVSQISRRTRIPLTTTHRIVSELMATGALEREPTGEYRVGLRLWEIAALAPRSVGLQRMALPFMQDLFETAHYPVHLAVREQEEVVFVERLVARGSRDERPRVGSRYDLHLTAVGMVLLAYAPIDVQNRVLSRPLTARTEYTETDPARLRQMLAEVRRDGFAVGARQINPRLTAMAAPIFGPDGEILAALSMIVPHQDVEGRSLGYLVKAAAKGISRTSRGALVR